MSLTKLFDLQEPSYNLPGSSVLQVSTILTQYTVAFWGHYNYKLHVVEIQVIVVAIQVKPVKIQVNVNEFSTLLKYLIPTNIVTHLA